MPELLGVQKLEPQLVHHRVFGREVHVHQELELEYLAGNSRGDVWRILAPRLDCWLVLERQPLDLRVGWVAFASMKTRRLNLPL